MYNISKLIFHIVLVVTIFVFSNGRGDAEANESTSEASNEERRFYEIELFNCRFPIPLRYVFRADGVTNDIVFYDPEGHGTIDIVAYDNISFSKYRIHGVRIQGHLTLATLYSKDPQIGNPKIPIGLIYDSNKSKVLLLGGEALIQMDEMALHCQRNSKSK